MKIIKSVVYIHSGNDLYNGGNLGTSLVSSPRDSLSCPSRSLSEGRSLMGYTPVIHDDVPHLSVVSFPKSPVSLCKLVGSKQDLL